MERNKYNWEIDKKDWGDIGRFKWEGLWPFGHFAPDDSLAKTGKFEFKYWSFPKGKTNHKPKKQKEAIEYTFIIKGEIEGWIKNKNKKILINLRKNDYIIIKPNCCNNIVEKVKEDVSGITIKVPSVKNDTKRPC